MPCKCAVRKRILRVRVCTSRWVQVLPVTACHVAMVPPSEFHLAGVLARSAPCSHVPAPIVWGRSFQHMDPVAVTFPACIHAPSPVQALGRQGAVVWYALSQDARPKPCTHPIANPGRGNRTRARAPAPRRCAVYSLILPSRTRVASTPWNVASMLASVACFDSFAIPSK